ncbi:MAG TPA: histidine kinase [Blastocatellia bacterium]|nr:histidine kinase [Blastocatellia bacterium]
MKWAVIFLCWTGFALFFTSQSYMFQARSAGTIEWKGPLFNWLLGSYTWFVFTPLILKLSNSFPLQRGKLLRSVGTHLLAAPVFNILTIIIFVIARGGITGPLPGARALYESARSFFVAEFHGGILLYWAIICISQAIDYYRRYRDRELLASNLETRLVEARLNALRMQLHPHFLFNALNSVSVLMRKDVDAADRMLIRLSGLLRVTLAGTEAHEIKLRHELEILERYLEIEQIRFQDRLTVRMQVDQSALDGLVPQLFFQPLVENAIRHGIADREIGGTIDVRAERQNDMLHLQVRDNGPGLDISRGNLTEGVGLSNTRARLEYLYGAGSRFEVCGAEEGGLIVTAAFPFHTETIIEVGLKR